MSEVVIPVPKSFTNKFPNLSAEKANKYWNTYLYVLSKYTLKPYLSLSNGTALNFPYGKARDECSTFNYQKKRYSVWAEFGEGAGFIQLIKKGSNISHQNSEIVITDTRHFKYLLDTSNNNEILNIYYGDIDQTTEFDYAPINMLSLEHFIRSTERETKNANHSHNYIDTLHKNLLKARTIHIIASQFNNTLPQRISSSSYGRRYYKGINLQNCHKLLRQAALGKCYEYDLKTAVYAVKLMIAKDIFNHPSNSEHDFNDFFPYTKQYIEQKDFIRETLAEIITSVPKDMRVKVIKRVMTAVGFGATVSSPSWSGSAIADIVMNKQNRIDLIDNEWFNAFVKEQQDLSNFIVDYYLNVDKDFKESIKDVGKIKVGNKYNKKQVMSYIFQTLEYQIMNEICKHIPDKIIQLRVHDAVYTRSEIFSETRKEINLTLADYSEYLELEHDKKKDRHDPYKDMFPSEQEVKEHKQLIKQEETLAQEYDKTLYTDSINVKQLRGQQEHDDSMLQTQTYKSMNESERKDYRRILGIQTNDDAVQESINELLRGNNNG